MRTANSESTAESAASAAPPAASAHSPSARERFNAKRRAKGPVMAKTPRLVTKSRVRGPNGPSSEEQELEAVEKARQEHIKRQKLNARNAELVCAGSVKEVLPTRSSKR